MMTTTQQPVMDIQTTGLLSADELRIKTPGVALPIELIDWLRTYPGVVQIRVAQVDELGKTDYIHFMWADVEINMFASVMIEMIVTFFGWDRQAVHFIGEWTHDDSDELAYAKHQLATVVPPLNKRVLHLQPGMIYIVDGTLEVGSMPDGRTAFRLV